MLQTAEKLRPVEGRVEGHFDDLRGWGFAPVLPIARQLRLFLGDPQTGPVIWLFNTAPVEASEGQAKPDTIPVPVHLHRSPSFRVALGDEPRQFQFDGDWYTNGDYVLLEANKMYSDPVGVDGLKELLVFDDRRGVIASNKDTAALSSDEMIASISAQFGPFGDGLAYVHTKDSEATTGAVMTTREKLQHGGRAKGSLHDHAEWSVLTDGSRIAAAFMGDPASGSAVIMSRNVPNAIESPAGRCGTDTFRVITQGSCTIGGQVYKTCSFLALEAGSPLGEVVHGPEGSTQLLFVTDRRQWAPLDRTRAPVTSARLGEISAVLAPFIAKPARAH